MKTKTPNPKPGKNEWKPIPGFSKYEINGKGEVRSKSTGKVLSLKGNTMNYQTYNDKNQYKSKPGSFFLGLFNEVTPDTKQSEAKTDKPVVVTPVKVTKTLDEVKKEHGVKTGLESTSGKIKALHTEGKTVKEIKEALNLTKGHYVNDVVWRIEEKKRMEERKRLSESKA